MIGQRIGHYHIVAQLGAGGMGEVYRAHDPRLERDVAIKIVNPTLTGDRSAVDRFVREARAASRLNHPNIVTIHDVGETETGRFIVTELVEGRTVRDVVESRVPWATAADIVRQAARALAAAHAAGIVHRDVKPENLMVRGDGLVKVLDFGLARLMPARDGDTEHVTASGTAAGIVLGTLRYMAPEQAAGRPAQVTPSVAAPQSSSTVALRAVAARERGALHAAPPARRAYVARERFSTVTTDRGDRQTTLGKRNAPAHQRF